MYKYLKLIRYQNLLITAFTLFTIRQLVIAPLLERYGVLVYSEQWHLWLLIISTVLLSAGGYVLNDYFDVKIDTLNNPDKVLVGRIISRNLCMSLYQILTATGLIVGFILSWLVKSRTLSIVFIIVTGLLWFYSASYKRQFIIGNLVVAFMTSLSILLVYIVESAYLSNHYPNIVILGSNKIEIFSWVAGFAIFSFILTLIREIIKDLEDEYGDREMECRTIPIVLGRKNSLVIIFSLIIVTISLLLYVNFYLIDFQGLLSLKYTIFGIIIPLLILIFLLIRAKKSSDYHNTSTFVKFIMLIGILYTFIFNFLLSQQTGIQFLNYFNIHQI
ncbi:geranylgeranylglycerol-phosphate geranylgeranyltransferase [Paludibacter sp.]